MEAIVPEPLSQAQAADRLDQQPEFQEYLKKHADAIRRTQDRMFTLIQQWIMVNRRYRGVTISDQIGGFASDPHLSPLGGWIDPVFDDPDQPDVHPINIVRPDIRANTNACLQANPSIEIEPGRKSAEIGRMAQMAQLIIDHKRRFAWREDQRTRLFDAVQKNSAQFVETYYDPEACGVKAKVPKFRSADAEKPTGQDVSESPLDQTVYPSDFQMKIALSEDGVAVNHPLGVESTTIEEGNVLNAEEIFEGYAEQDTGDTATRFHLAFNVAVDMIGGAKGGIKTATWLQIHDLVPRSELEAEYEHFEFGAPRDWCYALRCLHALMTNEWDVVFLSGSSRSDSSDFKDTELFEKRTIFLHEDAYRNYRFPKEFIFRGKNGQVKFRAERGQTIADAQKANWKHNHKGFRFVWVDDRLIDIITPDEQPVNFRECVTATYWLPVSGTYWSVPHWDIVQMNDDITNLNTFWMEHNGANVHTTILYDSEKFDRADFAYTHVGTKNGGLAAGQKMQDVALPIMPAQISGDLVAQLQFLLQIKDHLSGVQPAQRGEQQKGETYGAQRQQLEQAYGMLTTCLKSYSDCLIEWARHQLKLVQKRWTLEQFEAVAAEYGEIWDETDVEEFAKLDIERDFIIDYQTGTEMPQSNFARELKFMNIFPILMTLGQQGLIPMNIVMELVRTLANIADLDIDLTGLDTEEAIAQKRFTKLSEICAAAGQESDWATIQQLEGTVLVEEVPEVVDPATGEAVQPGTPAVTALDEIVTNLLLAAEAMPNPTDNAAVHIAFHTRRVKEELSSPRTNYLLTACLEELIAHHKDASLAQRQEQQLDALAEQMPGMEIANAAQQGAMAREQRGMGAEGEREQQAQDEQRRFEMQNRMLDLAATEADREFQSEQADRQFKNQLALEKEKQKGAKRAK